MLKGGKTKIFPADSPVIYSVLANEKIAKSQNLDLVGGFDPSEKY